MQISLTPLQVNGEAAAEECRANSLCSIHGAHVAIEVTAEILKVKANLHICCLDFLFIAPISRNSIFSEGINFGLIRSSLFGNHDRWNITIYCKWWLTSGIGAEPTTSHRGLKSQASDLRGKREATSSSLNNLVQPRCHRNQGHSVQTIPLLWQSNRLQIICSYFLDHMKLLVYLQHYAE